MFLTIRSIVISNLVNVRFSNSNVSHPIDLAKREKISMPHVKY